MPLNYAQFAEKVAIGEVGGVQNINNEFAGKIENMKIYKGMNAEKLAQLACAKHGRGLMSEVAKAEVKLKAAAPQANNQPRRAPRAQNQGPNRH